MSTGTGQIPSGSTGKRYSFVFSQSQHLSKWPIDTFSFGNAEKWSVDCRIFHLTRWMISENTGLTSLAFLFPDPFFWLFAPFFLGYAAVVIRISPCLRTWHLTWWATQLRVVLCWRINEVLWQWNWWKKCKVNGWISILSFLGMGKWDGKWDGNERLVLDTNIYQP